MPTDREKGERHEFVHPEEWLGLTGKGGCRLCSQPPDAEVHQVGQGQSTYDLYAARERAAACGKFNPCPLGDSGLPDHNFTCALLCQDCGMNEPAHAAPLPASDPIHQPERAAKTHAPEPGDGTDCWLCLLPKGHPIHAPAADAEVHREPLERQHPFRSYGEGSCRDCNYPIDDAIHVAPLPATEKPAEALSEEERLKAVIHHMTLMVADFGKHEPECCCSADQTPHAADCKDCECGLREAIEFGVEESGLSLEPPAATPDEEARLHEIGLRVVESALAAAKLAFPPPQAQPEEACGGIHVMQAGEAKVWHCDGCRCSVKEEK